MSSTIPPWAFDLIASLPDGAQEKLITVAGRAAMDPWFLAMASLPYNALLGFLPHALKLAIVVPVLNLSYNNVTPRQTDYDKETPMVSGIVHRCAAAHENSFEFLTFFAPAVLMAKVLKADGKAVRDICLRISALRTLYIFVYVFGAWKIVSYIRTLVWFAASTLTMDLYRVALGL
jgi:uncharacterized MAPEG superfamily protein